MNLINIELLIGLDSLIFIQIMIIQKYSIIEIYLLTHLLINNLALRMIELVLHAKACCFWLDSIVWSVDLVDSHFLELLFVKIIDFIALSVAFHALLTFHIIIFILLLYLV